MSLRDMISDGSVAIDAIARYLDGLAHDARLAESRSLDRSAQRQLYVKAAASPPLAIDDFVVPSTAARSEVIHYGRNTLPLPNGLRLFEKRFCRPDQGTGRLFGYNESPFKSTVGPGFFVTVPTAGNAEWESRGAIVIDYFQIPDGPVVAGWPKVVPNSKGLQRLVYYHTRDFMRRVSTHMTIGAAYKEEKALDHYFTLCRQPD